MAAVFGILIFVLYLYLVACFGISLAISYSFSSITEHSVIRIFLSITAISNILLALFVYLFSPSGAPTELLAFIVLQELVLIGLPLFFAFILEAKIYEFDADSMVPFIGLLGGLFSATVIATVFTLPGTSTTYIFITLFSGLLIFITPLIAVVIYTLFYRQEGLDFEDLPPTKTKTKSKLASTV